MFGKSLRRDLAQYFRRLWPYLLTLGVVGAFTCLIFLLDDNPVEATGHATGVAFFAVAALAFFIRGLVHAYKSFYDSVTLLKTDRRRAPQIDIAPRITAFMIFIVFTGLLLLAFVSTFAWEAVGRMFSSFNADWMYFVEFTIYMIIISVTLYIIPIALIVASRLDIHKQLAIVIGTITLFLCYVTVTPEILLLLHWDSTDMPSLWAAVMSLLALFIIADIGMFVLTRRTLKSTSCSKQNDCDK